jgi:hypothetical protein
LAESEECLRETREQLAATESKLAEAEDRAKLGGNSSQSDAAAFRQQVERERHEWVLAHQRLQEKIDELQAQLEQERHERSTVEEDPEERPEAA